MCSRKRVASGLARVSLVVLGSVVLASVGYATSMEYRSFDGSGNNTANTDWGSTDSQLLRHDATGTFAGTAYYADGISAPAGGDRPNTREVSNAVVAQSGSIVNAKGVSDMLMQWGQFLDHDIDLTRAGGVESMPIAVTGDPVFGAIYTSGEMPFSRSVYDPATGTGAGNPRQQTNAVTAFIDASQIYGSSKEAADGLRYFSGGKLKMSDDMLHMEGGVFVSGDERAREQVGLTSMHTLFNREHNRLAAELEAQYRMLPDIDGITPGHMDYEKTLDEKVYQEARKLVGGMMQAITFNEFLPALLGGGAPGTYGGYDAGVNPGIANEFSTAAYRFGHSTLSSVLLRLDANGNEIAAGHLALRDAFFTPETVLTDANGGIDPVLRGLVSQLGQEVDPFLVDDVRNLLFGPMGFDLAALNMQRGRDHGLPSYVEMRDVMFGNQMGYTTFNDWSDLDGIMADAIIDALQSVYDDVRDIDLWIGGLAEAHVNGGMLGELFSAIVGDQFSRLRDGDRFWYQNGMFETEWMEFIEGSTLSAIIMRNTGITGLQANVFFVPEPGVLLLLSIGIAGMGMRRKSSWRCAG